MEELLRWAEGQGAHVHNLELSAKNNRVFVAAEDIGKGDVVISLPQSMLLHANVAYEDEEWGQAFRMLRDDLGNDIDQRHILCLLLILERARAGSSRWAPYLDILPDTYDDPYWWSNKEVQLVAGTRLSKAIEQYRPGLDQMTAWVKRLDELHRSPDASSAAKDSPSALAAYKDGWAFTPQATCWARSTVWSRAFTVHQLCGRRSVVALIPVLDMIDHSPDVEAVWHTGPDGDQEFQFATLTPVKKGAIISNNYGNKTNDELLLAYGFVVADNPADYFQVSLARGASQPQPQSSNATGPSAVASPAAGSAPAVGAGRNGFAPPGSSAAAARAPAAVRGAGLGGGEEDEDAGADLQASCEELQRDVVLALMGLEPQHRLTTQQPLPDELVQCAQVGLLPPPELYHLVAHLQRAMQKAQQQQQQQPCDQEQGGQRQLKRKQSGSGRPDEAGAGAGDVQGQGAAAVTGTQPKGAAGASSSAAPQPEAGAGSGGEAGAKLPDVLPASAMHIVPRQRRGAQAGPSGSGTEAAAGHSLTPAARLAASLLLGGLGAGSSAAPEVAAGGRSEASAASEGSRARRALEPAFRQLPALVAVQQQVESKLRGMVSEQQARQLVSAPADAPSLLPHSCGARPGPGAGDATADATAGFTGPYGPRPPWLSQHAALALSYVRDQQRVLHASLGQLRARVQDSLSNMSLHAHPVAPSVSVLWGVPAFEFKQAPCIAGERPAGAGTGGQQGLLSTAPHPLCTAPAVFDASGQQHMEGYMQWLSSALAGEGCGARVAAWRAASGGSGEAGGGEQASSSGHPALGLCEVMCRVKREALSSAAAASRAAAAASASGSRGRRKPLASLTLRSLRNISSSSLAAARLGAGGAAAAATAAPGAAAPAPAAAGGGSGNPTPSVSSHSQGQAKSGPDSDACNPAPSQQAVVPSLPPGIAASLGLDMLLAYDSVSWGAVTTVAYEPGDILLEVPYDFAIVAGSRTDLLYSLMIPAHDLLQELVAHAAAAGQKQQAGAASEGRSLQPRDMLVLHLMHTVGAPPASRLPASENNKVSMLLEMLEDSPVGCDCQEAFESLKSDYQELSTFAAAASQSLSANAKHKSMRKVLAWPGAFGLYCWAVGVLERCAVQVPRQPGGTLWCVLPVVSAVPAALRSAAMRVEVVADGSEALLGRLRVSAACALPAGTLLSPALLLPFDNVDRIISTYGPEALAWRRLLARQHQAPAPRTSDLGSSAVSPASGPATRPGSPAAWSPGMAHCQGGTGSGAGSSNPEEQYMESMRAAGPRVLHELYIAPGEDDPLHQEKMELLAAAGLGCTHFLTEGLESKTMVLSALKICFADEELLSQPAVQQVMQLNHTLKMHQQEQAAPAQMDTMHPTSMAGAAGTEAAGAEDGQEVVLRAGREPTPGVEGAGPGRAASGVAAGAAVAPSGAGPPPGFWKLVQQSQQELLRMLEGLPADYPAAVAASKQLRQIVHDAQKHTKRRLRQMDTHDEQRTGSGGFWNTGSGGGSAAQQQQQQVQQQHMGLELLRQGVHLYLEELVLVLGVWAQDLGLESKLDPACRRSKVEPSCKRPKLRHGGSV